MRNVRVIIDFHIEMTQRLWHLGAQLETLLSFLLKLRTMLRKRDYWSFLKDNVSKISIWDNYIKYQGDSLEEEKSQRWRRHCWNLCCLEKALIQTTQVSPPQKIGECLLCVKWIRHSLLGDVCPWCANRMTASSTTLSGGERREGSCLVISLLCEQSILFFPIDLWFNWLPAEGVFV